MVKKHNWVLVAERSGAKILQYAAPLGELSELEDLPHPEGKLHEGDLASDKPGRHGDPGPGGVGASHHQVARRDVKKDHETELFAKRLADHLEEKRIENRFGELTLVASPELLGMLRKHLSPSCRKLIRREVDKNLLRHSLEEIRDAVQG